MKFSERLRELRKSKEYTSESIKNMILSYMVDQKSVNYPNGKEVSNDDVNLDIALDYMFGEDRDPNNDNYTDDEKQRAINYWIEKTDSPFPGLKDKTKSINEDTYYRTPKEWVIDGKEGIVGYEYINK